eukprot:403362983
MTREALDLQKFHKTALTPDSIEKNADLLKSMKNDKFFQQDELIQNIKLDDQERTNWRRIRSSPPIPEKFMLYASVAISGFVLGALFEKPGIRETLSTRYI